MPFYAVTTPIHAKFMREFKHEGEKYQIDNSKVVANGGDFDEVNKVIFIDKAVPEKFHEGIAVHEIEERKLLKKGHSYVFAHNEAQKKELEFYEKVYGKDNGLKILEEEEDVILAITHRRTIPKKSKIIEEEEEEEKGEQPPMPISKPIIEMRTIKEIIFENKKYIIDNSERLIGTLADVYEKGNTIYIDCDAPERFYEGLSLHELVMRKNLKKGLSFTEANTEAAKIEQDFLTIKYGAQEGKEIFDDEKRLQAWKYAREKEDLATGEHKVIYEKGEILPK
jgi:hypothetical protein